MQQTFTTHLTFLNSYETESNEVVQEYFLDEGTHLLLFTGYDRNQVPLYTEKVVLLTRSGVPCSLPIKLKLEEPLTDEIIKQLKETASEVEPFLIRAVLFSPVLTANEFAESLRNFLMRGIDLTSKQKYYLTSRGRGYRKTLLDQVLAKDSLFVERFLQLTVARSVYKPDRIPIQKLKLTDNDYVETKNYPHFKYKFKWFNPVQAKVLEVYSRDTNVVVATGTSTGKTVCAELLMHHMIKQGKKVLYLSPLRALTSEKYRDWKDLPYKVEIITGDHVITAEKLQALNEADIICMTYEAADSRSRKKHIEKNNWLDKVGLIIADEIHIVGVEGRGHTAEVGIARIARATDNAKIMLLSATIPNVEDFVEWVPSLNDKPTVCIHTDWRPTKLHINFCPIEVSDKPIEDFILKVVEIIKSKPEEKFLVFVHAKSVGRRIVKKLQLEGMFAMFHNADLDKEIRADIEEAFRTGALNILVSTSTLAWGVNLPARNVIIVGVTRGIVEVSELDIIQMMGRAGRYGIDDEGFVYFILPKQLMGYWKRKLENPSPVKSTLLHKPYLAFHILGAIYTQDVKTSADIQKWYTQTLAYTQGEKLNTQLVDAVLNDLLLMDMIKFSGPQISLTQLGRIAAMLYFSPYDVYHWYKHFSVLFEDFDPHKLKEIPVALIAWAIGDIPYLRMPYPVDEKSVPKTIREKYANLASTLEMYGYDFTYHGLPLVFCVYSMLKNQELYEGTPSSFMPLYYTFTRDLGRIVVALQLIDAFKGRWNVDWDYLYLKLAYNVDDSLLELVSLKGIGKVRAEALASLGITKLSDIINRKEEVKELLGNKLTNRIIREIKKKLNIS